ncbi:MAG: NACHT domain-containing protein, partial [Planctomycetaceae bacterium]
MQEDFTTTAGSTLQKLDHYIQACQGVIHIIGRSVGDFPETIQVRQLLQQYPDLPAKLPPLEELLQQEDPGISYTQWEAWLCLYHQRPLFVYRPRDLELQNLECPREPEFSDDRQQWELQKQHYQRICAMGHDRGQFLNPERLSSAVLRDLVDILPRLDAAISVPPTELRHSAATLVGREMELSVLDDAWQNPQCNVVVVRGRGGEGKTSLVAEWMAELALKNWRGAERVFDESFYSQGTSNQSTATSQFFLQRMLIQLKDPDPAYGDEEARAARLVRLLQEQRTLLVLDGLEPLQYPPGPLHGSLHDRGMRALITGLAAQNTGLLVITTREFIGEIQQHYNRTAIDLDLKQLSPVAGANVLYNAGATRAGAALLTAADLELQQASGEVDGHALTLFLIGLYLKLRYQGDIRRRQQISLAAAEVKYRNDPTNRYGHAFKAMAAYEHWFSGGPPEHQQQLSVLRLLGLFDRPASRDCLQMLRTAGISGLTDIWQRLTDGDWHESVSFLSETGLITVSEATIDAHPLIREYFSQQLRQQQPETFKAAHGRIFDHLCQSTPHLPDDLPGLQPLYQAVVHGCLADRQEEARAGVYRDRIRRGAEAYSIKKLGAFGADLSAVAAFFEQPWSRVSAGLS